MSPNDAYKIIQDMDAGRITWDDNLRSQATDALRTVGADQQGNPIGGGGGDPISNALAAILGAIPEPVTPYDEVNPFFFDEALAREASTAEYAPYYDEMLSDYITGVERTKSRSSEDLAKTLEQLEAGKEYYTGKERRVLDRALRTTNEGYAGRGLFFSGARERDIQELQTEYGADIGDYTRRYESAKKEATTADTRTQEDVGLAQSMYTRDIEREKKFGIESGVLQREGEAKEEYEIARKKYYQDSGIPYYG